MPPSPQICSHEFDFKHFIDHVFIKFIDSFIKEMIDAFLQLKFWSLFDIFDPRKLSQSVTEISNYENREITLIDHYIKEKGSTIKSVTINLVGDIHGIAEVKEWLGFHNYMFQKHNTEEEKFQMKLMNCRNEKERDTFHASETSFNAHKLYSTCLTHYVPVLPSL